MLKNGVGVCVLFCLRPLVPFERCGLLFLTKNKLSAKAPADILSRGSVSEVRHSQLLSCQNLEQWCARIFLSSCWVELISICEPSGQVILIVVDPVLPEDALPNWRTPPIRLFTPFVTTKLDGIKYQSRKWGDPTLLYYKRTRLKVLPFGLSDYRSRTYLFGFY